MEKAEQENAEVAGDDDEEEIEGQMFSAGEEGENGEGEAGSGEEDWNSDFRICNKNAVYWPVCNSILPVIIRKQQLHPVWYCYTQKKKKKEITVNCMKNSAFCFCNFMMESDKLCSCMKLLMPKHSMSQWTEAVFCYSSLVSLIGIINGHCCVYICIDYPARWGPR